MKIVRDPFNPHDLNSVMLRKHGTKVVNIKRQMAIEIAVVIDSLGLGCRSQCAVVRGGTRLEIPFLVKIFQD